MSNPAAVIPEASGATVVASIKLSQSESLLLDVIRFVAALAVLAHHLSDSALSVRWMKLGVIGYHAVCVFFVLSGFVIRFVTVSRPTTGLEYTNDRVTRLYSVVAPALLFTLLCELLARAVNPAMYAVLREPFLWSHVPAQMLANLTFTGQCWGMSLTPLSNDPFWSLSYEAIYYAVYGLLLYRLRGAWLWVALILLVAGPNIAGLGITWAIGAYTVDLYLMLKRARRGVMIAWLAVAGLLGVLVAVRHPLGHAIHLFNHDERLAWMTEKVASWSFLPVRVRAFPVEWISQLSPSFGVLAVITAALMLALMLTLAKLHPNLPPRLTTRVRWIANGTFALYLFHVPAMILIVSVIGHPIRTKAGGVLLALVVTVGAIYLSVYLDQLKNVMRDGLRRLQAKGVA